MVLNHSATNISELMNLVTILSTHQASNEQVNQTPLNTPGISKTE